MSNNRIAVFVISIFLLASSTSCSSSDSFEAEGARVVFEAQRSNFEMVVDFLGSSDRDVFFLRRDDPAAICPSSFRLPAGIDSTDQVTDGGAICALFGEGFSLISWRRDEGVVFLRWTRFRSEGRGIAHLPHGHQGDGASLIPHMVELVQLQAESWYYYVDNFYEWRRQDPCRWASRPSHNPETGEPCPGWTGDSP